MRIRNLIGFFVGVGLLIFALLLEHFRNLTPCPLCVFQRIFFGVMGVLFLFAAIQNPKKIGQRIYLIFIFIVGLLGVAAAWRQLWLQANPVHAATTSCVPGLTYLLKVLPLSEAFKIMLNDPSNCAKVDWTFLHLSIPAWSLIWFILLLLFCCYQFLKA